ncbi:hypothetical protein ACTFIR_005594 [Dictyostelium discoideum]
MSYNAIHLKEVPPGHGLEENENYINYMIFKNHHFFLDDCLNVGHTATQMYQICLKIINEIINLHLTNIYFYVGVAQAVEDENIHHGDFTNNVCHDQTMKKRNQTMNNTEKILKGFWDNGNKSIIYKPNWIVLSHGKGDIIADIERKLIDTFLKGITCGQYQNCLNCIQGASENDKYSVLYLKLYNIEKKENVQQCKNGGFTKSCKNLENSFINLHVSTNEEKQDQSNITKECYFYPIISRISQLKKEKK